MKGSSCFVAISILGCLLATTPALADDIDEVLNTPLKADEGILVIAVDSEFAFRALRIKRDGELVGNLYAIDAPAGKSLYMVVVPKGHYEWKEILQGVHNFQRGTVLVSSTKYHYDFDVQAGKVNYPGDFVISTNQGEALTNALKIVGIKYAEVGLRDIRYYTELRDRLGTVLGQLSPEQHQAIDRLGFIYVGPGSDSFNNYYHSAIVTQGGKP